MYNNSWKYAAQKQGCQWKEKYETFTKKFFIGKSDLELP